MTHRSNLISIVVNKSYYYYNGMVGEIILNELLLQCPGGREQAKPLIKRLLLKGVDMSY